MPLKNVSAQVTVTSPSTYSWQVTNNTCSSAPIFSSPLSGNLTAGTTTLSQTISFEEDCEVSVCLTVIEDDCTEITCFNLVENTIHEEYSWSCLHTTEQQFECVYVENANGGFPTEQACENCKNQGTCPACQGTPCNNYTMSATYNCDTGLSLSWVGMPYTGTIECLYLTVNVATQPCTENIIAQNISGSQLSNITGMFPNGTYGIGVSAQLANGCIISSNPIVIDCLGTIEWNLECCQTVDTSGIMAGYEDKYYILDITNNDLSQPIYTDFSFFQVADRLKFYDFSEVIFTNGIPTNLNSITPIADTYYVGKNLPCYPTLFNSYSGFVEKEDNDPPSAQGQSDTVMQSLSPSWSLLFPCNNTYTQSYTSPLYCPQCTFVNSVYIIPKNCANAPNVPDCEPVDIIGCGRLTITPTALATVGTVQTGSPVSTRKKLFVHLESNDCNTGCTAAVFKILCPGCYGCEIDCDISYSCTQGLQFTNCEDVEVKKCTFDANGAEICVDAVEGEFLANGTHYIKAINTSIDNCFESTPIQVNCPTCTTPQIRSVTSGCVNGDRTKGLIHADFSTTHTTAYVHFGVLIQGDYVPGMYHNKYVGYDCNVLGCAGYVQIQATGIISGGYYWYQSVAFVPINSTLALVFLFDDTSGTLTDLVNTDYRIKVTDGACSAEYPKVQVHCIDCEHCESNLAGYHFGTSTGTSGDYLLSNIQSTVNNTGDFSNVSINNALFGGISLDYSTITNSPTIYYNDLNPSFADISTLSSGYHPWSFKIEPTPVNSSLVPSTLSIQVQTYVYKDALGGVVYNSLFKNLSFTHYCSVVNPEEMTITGQLLLETQLPLTTYTTGDLTVTLNGNPGTIVNVSGGLDNTAIDFSADNVRNGTNVLAILFKSSYSGSTGVDELPAYTDLIQNYTITYTIACP